MRLYKGRIETVANDVARAFAPVRARDPVPDPTFERHKKRGKFPRGWTKGVIRLTLPHPMEEAQWYTGLLPWFRDFDPWVRGYMLLIAAAWVPCGHWNHKEWRKDAGRVVVGSWKNGLISRIDPTDPDVFRLWRIALDVPIQQVGAFAVTNVYARDKLLRLMKNVRQADVRYQRPLVEEIFRTTLPRPEQLRPKNMHKAPPVRGRGKW